MSFCERCASIWSPNSENLVLGTLSLHRSCVVKKKNIYIFFHNVTSYSSVIYFRVKEEVFWKNYFYRVSLIKQSAQLTELAVQQAAGWRKVEKAGSDSEAVHQKGKTKVHVFSLLL